MNYQISKYDSLAIWYFSGTGNAQFAAEQIKANAEKLGINATVQRIISKKPIFDPDDENTLIGFCYPTHGFNAPPAVLKFIWNFPKGKSKVFFLNTRAGMKLYRIHTSGVGGIALWLPALILLLKGYKPIGFRPLDMPSNWVSLHPGLRSKVINSIQNRCANTLAKFSKRIFCGKPVLNGFLWLPLDIALIPISIGYYLFGRFFLAKTFFANYNCNNCNLCITQCPVKAIAEKSKRPYWTFSCESCMKCMNSCPKRAIETAHGFTAIIWWLAFSLLPYHLLKLLTTVELISDSFFAKYGDLLHDVAMVTLGFVIIFFGYSMLHQLLRVKLFNKLITYTSLTHYKFWRRYKLPKS